MFRVKCFCVWWFIVIINIGIFDFYVSLCIVLLFIAFFPLLYLWYFCVHWFIWVQCDFDIWLFLWLINFTSVIDVAVFFFLSLMFLCILFFQKIFFFMELIYIKPGLFNCILYYICVSDNYLSGLVCFWMFHFVS